MALSTVIDHVTVVGEYYDVEATITPDSSYRNAGSGDHGETLSGTDLGLDLELVSVLPIGLLQKTDGTSAYAAHYDAGDGELKFYKANGTTDLTPVANAVDLSTYRLKVRARGRGSDLSKYLARPDSTI